MVETVEPYPINEERRRFDDGYVDTGRYTKDDIDLERISPARSLATQERKDRMKQSDRPTE